VQHEVDHLDGILYTMRMDDLTQLGFDSEMKHVIARVQQGAEAEAADEEAKDEQSG
jgi:peptide deformylase